MDPRRRTASIAPIAARARRGALPFLVLALVSLLVGSACVTPRVDDPPLAIEIHVTGLRHDERLELRDRVCALEGVTDCLLVDVPAPEPSGGRKSRKREQAPPPPSPEARITFSYRGSLGSLRWRIAQLPHPGLEALRADARLGYRGFDNKAPTITIVEPRDGTVTSSRSIQVVVRVPDVDLAAVDIGDEGASKSGDTLVATVEDLRDGENAIVVKATDQAGNVGEATIRVIVDTTPPDLQVEVQILSYEKALVRGKVGSDCEKLTIDGQDVNRDLFGAFEKEVRVDPDKSTTEIVAVDAYGNAKKLRRSVKIASPMSEHSMK
jgi:hypothetical protein